MMGTGDPNVMRPWLDKNDIKTFNWKELDGKDVRVVVVEDSGAEVAALFLTETSEFFIVSIKKPEETK